MKRILIIILMFSFIFLIGCNKEGAYKITYNFNGGGTSEEYTTSFNNTNSIVLPTPTKEGYIFIGWAENSIFVTTFEKRDYELIAVWVEDFEYETIQEEDIFNQEQAEYFVYIYRDGCSWCNKISDKVKAYIYKTTLPQYASSKKVYVLNLTENGERAEIFRTYTGEGGQGTDGKFFVDGATQWDQIYIYSTPTLISVSSSGDKQSATLLASGATKVVNLMNEGLIVGDIDSELRQSYSIEYELNGGTFEGDVVNSFYGWTNVILPVPIKEGYIFAGWYENSERVNKLSAKNYTLSAKWLEVVDPNKIMADEIFKQQYSEYYVLFIRGTDTQSYLDEILKIASAYCTLYNDTKPLYIINLNDGNNSLIKRSYMGEDGQSDSGRFFVDGVTIWNELYIPLTPALIKITLNNDIKTSYYINNAQNIYDYFEGILYR